MKPLPILAALVAVLTVSGCATKRQDPTQIPQPVALFAGPEYIPEKRRSIEPFAHVVFCNRTPGECRRSGDVAAVTLTAARMEELEDVNRTVNAQIVAGKDPADDTWTLSPATGDCEDYAVTKRHVLIARGWPASALKLAIGTTSAQEGHLVLVIRTTKGDLVLDNLHDDARGWQDAGLSWLSIQSGKDPRIWHQI